MPRWLEISLILLSAPIWGILLLLSMGAVAVALGRPIFFRQPRPGLNGEIFTLIKLRTMRQGTASDNQRMTRVGNLLRKTSLDELPELLLVLQGKMALVGPRPLLVDYLPLYNESQRHRHDVRPGITGWAQVNGRNATTWEVRFEQDLYYVQHRSFWLDCRIIALTLVKVFKREGTCEMALWTPERASCARPQQASGISEQASPLT